MSDELKPCSVCKTEAGIYCDTDSPLCYIGCRTYDCMGFESVWFDEEDQADKDNAVKIWNSQNNAEK